METAGHTVRVSVWLGGLLNSDLEKKGVNVCYNKSINTISDFNKIPFDSNIESGELFYIYGYETTNYPGNINPGYGIVKYILRTGGSNFVFQEVLFLSVNKRGYRIGNWDYSDIPSNAVWGDWKIESL